MMLGCDQIGAVPPESLLSWVGISSAPTDQRSFSGRDSGFPSSAKAREDVSPDRLLSRTPSAAMELCCVGRHTVFIVQDRERKERTIIPYLVKFPGQPDKDRFFLRNRGICAGNEQWSLVETRSWTIICCPPACKIEALPRGEDNLRHAISRDHINV